MSGTAAAWPLGRTTTPDDDVRSPVRPPTVVVPWSPPVPRGLLALAIGAFGIGTTEFVVMGMLPEIADGFGVSVSAVGLLISAYAVGVVVGAPTLTALGVRFTPRQTPAGPVA